MTEYGQQSLWRDTVTLTPERARERADRLERRASAEDEISARDAYLTLLGLSAGDVVLDVGCGSGAVTREIARRVGPRGRVVGLDQSPGLLTEARRLAESAGLRDWIEFREGSALQLPFGDASFDALTCVTVLCHTPRGEAAIPEFARVLRPGGRLGVFDLDTDMTTFTHPDRALTRRIVAAASDATAVNGWLIRKVPALLQQAGFCDVRARGFFPIDMTSDSFYASMAERCAGAALKAGAITEVEHRRWLEAFATESAGAPIVAGRLHIFVWGCKPF